MSNKIFNSIKPKINIILLLTGLIFLSCTIFTFFGYGLRVPYLDIGTDDRDLLAISNFFSMILGGVCLFVDTNYQKVEFEYYQSIITPGGIVLFSLQILLIVITVLALILICIKANGKKVIYSISGLAIACCIASTVLALTPQLYTVFCAEDGAVFNIFDYLGDKTIQNIELTSAQICYVVFASIGLLAIITSVILTIRNNLNNKTIKQKEALDN